MTADIDGCSKSSISTLAITPAVKNCTQEITTPSAFGEKWSITRICTENTTEHISTSRSPAPMEKDSVIHKKYMPTAAITALIQMLMPIFFFKNSPINGTIMI